MSASRQILYVDDDAGLRRLVQRALERRGFTVETADGADAAMERLAEHAFDLVAVDHYMPGRNGLALLADIIALPNAPPVVFVTGTDETQVAVTALKSGAADFVVKALGEDFFDLLANSFEQALEKVALQRAKDAMENELRDANARLEALLGEVHHRVGNSLQLVSSLVTLQARRTEDAGARAALEETQGRIHAVAQVHHRLYTSRSTEAIELDAYLDTLLGGLRSTLGPQVELTLRADPVVVRPDQAVSVGVIVTELVSNAAKYAFAPGASGRIDVAVRGNDGGGFTVEVGDDGRGFDPSAPAQGTGLGMSIIGAMARSLRSELTHLPAERGSRMAIAVGS